MKRGIWRTLGQLEDVNLENSGRHQSIFVQHRKDALAMADDDNPGADKHWERPTPQKISTSPTTPPRAQRVWKCFLGRHSKPCVQGNAETR